MHAFLVDGSERNFADIVLENKVNGSRCMLSSWGFGVRQVERLISAFDFFLLIADESHSKLNKNAYRAITKMSKNLSNFVFIPIKTHAKIALIDDQTIIFTSANLSANRRTESYLIGEFSEIKGIEKIKKWMGVTGKIEKLGKDEQAGKPEYLGAESFDLPNLNFGV